MSEQRDLFAGLPAPVPVKKGGRIPKMGVVESFTRAVAPLNRPSDPCGACGVIGERRAVWVLARKEIALACTACDWTD